MNWHHDVHKQCIGLCIMHCRDGKKHWGYSKTSIPWYPGELFTSCNVSTLARKTYTLNFRTTISLPWPPRCTIVTHKAYTYAGLFIRWILIGKATDFHTEKTFSSKLENSLKCYRNTTRLLKNFFLSPRAEQRIGPRNLRLSKPTDMPIHWKALEEHFLMVPLIFTHSHNNPSYCVIRPDKCSSLITYHCQQWMFVGVASSDLDSTV
jgi:hypothetical protein